MYTPTHTMLHPHTHTQTYTHPHSLPPVQSDMADKREVSYGEGELLARTLNCPFFETTAKLRIHIDECFHDLVREIKKVHSETAKEKPEKSNSQRCCVLL